MTAFGDRFAEERRRANKSMGDVARHLGTSVAYISKVEHGDASPLTDDKIIAVCDLFGIPPATLLTVKFEQRGSVELPFAAESTARRELQMSLLLASLDGKTDDQVFADLERTLLEFRKGKT